MQWQPCETRAAWWALNLPEINDMVEGETRVALKLSRQIKLSAWSLQRVFV